MNIYEEAKVITHEEARKELLVLNDKVDRNSFQNEYATLDNYITEQQAKDKVHEELVRDVKRFNELRASFRCAPETLSVDDIKEYELISDKIWKVGKEK